LSGAQIGERMTDLKTTITDDLKTTIADDLLKSMPLANKVELLDKMRESIFSDFGYKVDPTGELRNSLDVWWTGGSQSVKFGQTSSPKDDVESEAYYGNDIVRSQVKRSDTHTLMFVDNGQGEEYWQIFSNSNEVTDEETLELFEGLF